MINLFVCCNAAQVAEGKAAAIGSLTNMQFANCDGVVFATEPSKYLIKLMQGEGVPSNYILSYTLNMLCRW